MPNFSPKRQGKKRGIVGIDLRAFSVKVVEVAISTTGKSVEKWGMKDFESATALPGPIASNPKLIALKSILIENKIKTKDAAVCISGPEVVVRHLVVPKISHADTCEAIKLQIGNWISFPIEEVVFDFVALKETEGQVHYLVAVAREGLINETLAVLKACGLNALFISVIPLALLNALPLKPAEKEEATCLIYMGKHNTNINIFRNGILEFNREVTVGGDFITRSMLGVILTEKERVELKYGQAEKLKKEMGIPLELDDYTKKTGIPAVQVLAFMRPALEKIEAELLRSFNYYRSQFGEGEITRIVITGGASKVKNLTGLLEEALGIPVETGAPGFEAPEGLKELLPNLVVAIGVALEPPQPRINLLPDEIKNRWGVLLKKLLRPEVSGAVLLAGVSMIYLGMLGVGFFMQNSLNRLDAEIKNLSPEIRRVDQLTQRVKGMETGKSVFFTILKEHKKIVSLLEDLGRIVPESVVLEAVDVGGDEAGLKFSGLAFSYNSPREEVLAKFIAGLERLKAVGGVELVSARADDSYTEPALNFLINARLEK